MRIISLDFRYIADRAEFYRQFAEKCQLSEAFGANLDALWDVLTGELALPVKIELTHLHRHPHRAQFAAIIATLEEAAEELDGALLLTRN
ncbi:barstar family protein [Winslowiella iniecta]|uniref:Ribonuclease inhibitor n=1 Tax=Winslowiella iniecta TaxID=1560201 RepID=A0A0L7THK9_9GAMM|nr:barstar family protein [Winslowiella iniecta]KOC89291.1 ribonuclease inhibitor [Winslowiella iniecta]KOC94858.1 ribonuclease inhibitor [Winslowiella iniecta]